MNLSYSGDPSELIAPTFNARTYPLDISNMYNALYPSKPNRYTVQFYTYYYLRILQACQQDDVVYYADPRVTYNLDTDFTYFNIYSNVVESTPPGFELVLNGDYIPSSTVTSNTEVFNILTSGTLTATVRSVTTGDYFTTTARQSIYTSACSQPIVQDGGLNKSKVIAVGDTGLSFSILGNFSSIAAIPTPFIFKAYAPLIFNYTTVMANAVHNTELVTALFSDYSYLTYELNLYRTATTDVLKLAAILRALYKRMLNA